MEAQMQRHFLSQPVLPATQQAQQQAQQQQQQQQQPASAEQPSVQLTREQALAALAAGHDTLVSVYKSAQAEGRDALAATEATAMELMLNASHTGSSGAVAAASSTAAAPQAEQQQQAQQQAQQQVQEPPEQRRFRAFTYLSQLQQGLAYQTAIQQWRRNKADRQARVSPV